MFCITRISCSLIIVISVIILESFANENDGRQRSINDPQPFRLNKLNVMWEKAKQVIVTFHIRYFDIWHACAFVEVEYANITFTGSH